MMKYSLADLGMFTTYAQGDVVLFCAPLAALGEDHPAVKALSRLDTDLGCVRVEGVDVVATVEGMEMIIAWSRAEYEANERCVQALLDAGRRRSAA